MILPVHTGRIAFERQLWSEPRQFTRTVTAQKPFNWPLRGCKRNPCIALRNECQAVAALLLAPVVAGCVFGGGAGRGKQRDAATKFAAVWAPAKGNAKRKSNDPGILAESNSITRST
jgi:hypothetical protein